MKNHIDEIIEKAMHDGHFDDLPGFGKPFEWDDEAFVDPGVALANRLLKQNGFAPEPLMRRKDIMEEVTAARQSLERAWAFRQRAAANRMNPARVEATWSRAVARFRERMAQSNARITAFNLSTEHTVLHLPLIDVEAAIREASRG